MNAKGSDIRAGLTANPEHTKVSLVVKLVKLALVDRADTELTLDSGDQRGSLEQRTRQGLQGPAELSLAARDLLVQTDHANVFFSGTLLRLDKASGTVNADDQTTGDLRIKRSTMASFLGPSKYDVSESSPPV